MRKGEDIVAEFPDLLLIHHNLPGSHIEEHCHDEHEVIIPLYGELHFEFSGESVVAGPGKMVYVPPGGQHSFKSAVSQGERLIALVSNKLWKKHGCGTFAERVLPTSQLCKELLFYLLLHPETKNHKSIIETYVKTLDESLCSGSNSNFQVVPLLEAKIRDSRLKKAFMLLKEGFDKDISLADIAKRAGFSTRSMNRFFLAELGLTPKQALTHLRIIKANDLLLTTNLSVTQVSMEVGYGSLSNFIRNFQELTGQLPSEVARFGQKR